LQIQSVTVSALAFGKILSGAGPEVRYGLYTRPTYCEFWSQANGRLRSIKHVPMAGADAMPSDRAELLTLAIQRLILLAGGQDQAPPHQVTVYDADGRSDGLIDRLNMQLKPHITVSDGRAGLLSERVNLSGGPEDTQSIAAAAVAITGVGAEKPAVDFLNPRIGRKKTSSRKRVTTWAAVAGIVAVALVGAVVADWQIKRSDIAMYSQQLEAMSDDVEAAREMMQRMSYANSWTSQKPVFLDCLRQLTDAFPQRGSIWATSLALSETAQGSLVGKAVDEQSFYDVLNKIKESEAFSNVTMMYLRDAGGSSREKEFAVTFKFQGVR